MRTDDIYDIQCFAFDERKCPVCGKTFIVNDVDAWVYKIDYKKRKKTVCSYHCMREIQKKQENKVSARRKCKYHYRAEDIKTGEVTIFQTVEEASDFAETTYNVLRMATYDGGTLHGYYWNRVDPKTGNVIEVNRKTPKRKTEEERSKKRHFYEMFNPKTGEKKRFKSYNHAHELYGYDRKSVSNAFRMGKAYKGFYIQKLNEGETAVWEGYKPKLNRVNKYFYRSTDPVTKKKKDWQGIEEVKKTFGVSHPNLIYAIKNGSKCCGLYWEKLPIEGTA